MTARVLHAGCGGENLPQWVFDSLGFEGREVKLDADARLKPDIVASIDSLGDIGEFDAVFCCHCLEHLHWNDAMVALREFHRVLKPGGAALIEVPNLDIVRPDDTLAYTTPAGLEVYGMDMYFGHRGNSRHNPFMTHRCGFLPRTMQKALEGAGFNASVLTSGFDILGVGVK